MVRLMLGSSDAIEKFTPGEIDIDVTIGSFPGRMEVKPVGDNVLMFRWKICQERETAASLLAELRFRDTLWWMTISYVSTRSPYRRKSMATALVNAVLRTSEDLVADRVVAVGVHSFAARQLMRRCGFNHVSNSTYIK